MQFNRPDMVQPNPDDDAEPDVSERPVQQPSQLDRLPPQRSEPEPITEQDIDRSTTQTGEPYSADQAMAQDKARNKH